MPNWRGLPPMDSRDPLVVNSGLTRSSTRLARPAARPSSSITASSSSDSHTMARMPSSTQAASSARDFPGPSEDHRLRAGPGPAGGPQLRQR